MSGKIRMQERKKINIKKKEYMRRIKEKRKKNERKKEKGNID